MNLFLFLSTRYHFLTLFLHMVLLFFIFSDIFSRTLEYLISIITENTPNLLKIKPPSPRVFQFMPLSSDDIEVWFCHAGANFHGHYVTDPHAQLLAVVKALPRDFSRYIISSTFTGYVSEPYDTLRVRPTVPQHRNST